MKNPYFLFTLAILFILNIPTSSFAQTNVSGIINSNTVWDVNGSPYILTGNLLVTMGATLTINPGVIVKFNTDKALQIDGELIAIGNSQNRITFTSNQTNPAPGDWVAIQFTDSSEDAVFNSAGQYLSGSILQYCDITYGGGGTVARNGNLKMSFSAPYISYCRVSESEADGINGAASNSNIDNCTVFNNIGYGINMQSLNNSSISNDSIMNNALGGIQIEGMNNQTSRLDIKLNYFSENTYNGALYMPWAEKAVSIIGNEFVNNTSQIYPILYKWPYILDDTIACNRFIGNTVTFSASFIFQCSGFIANNYFENNSCLTGTSIVLAAVSSSLNTTTGFENNYFVNNTADVICKVNAGSTDQSTSNITNNTFINNISNSDFAILASANTNLNFKYNNFPDPVTKLKLTNITQFGVASVNLDSNYWYGTSASYLDSVIYDFFDDANLSVVYVNTALGNQLPVDTGCTFITTGILNLAEKNAFKIYPNPAQKHISLQFQSRLESGTLNIYNLLGKNCYSKKISNSSEENLDVSGLTKGIYIVRIQEGTNTLSQKLIIE